MHDRPDQFINSLLILSKPIRTQGDNKITVQSLVKMINIMIVFDLTFPGIKYSLQYAHSFYKFYDLAWLKSMANFKGKSRLFSCKTNWKAIMIYVGYTD